MIHASAGCSKTNPSKCIISSRTNSSALKKPWPRSCATSSPQPCAAKRVARCSISWGRLGPERVRWLKSYSVDLKGLIRSTRLRAHPCRKSRSCSSLAICGKNSRKCSMCGLKATSVRSRAGACVRNSKTTMKRCRSPRLDSQNAIGAGLALCRRLIRIIRTLQSWSALKISQNWTATQKATRVCSN